MTEPRTDEEYRIIANAISARILHQMNREIDIDDDAHVARAHDHLPEDSARCRNADEDGAYVQGWLWVPNNA